MSQLKSVAKLMAKKIKSQRHPAKSPLSKFLKNKHNKKRLRARMKSKRKSSKIPLKQVPHRKKKVRLKLHKKKTSMII